MESAGEDAAAAIVLLANCSRKRRKKMHNLAHTLDKQENAIWHLSRFSAGTLGAILWQHNTTQPVAPCTRLPATRL